AVAIEWGDLDRDDIFDLCEPAPERVAEGAPADGGLQVEAEQGPDLGQNAAVLQQRIVADSRPKPAQLNEDRVIAQVGSQACFANGLLSTSAHARDSGHWPIGFALHHLARQLQDWFQES